MKNRIGVWSRPVVNAHKYLWYFHKYLFQFQYIYIKYVKFDLYLL